MQFPNEALQNFQDRSNDLRNAERNLCNWLAKYFQETEPDIEEGTFLVLSELGNLWWAAPISSPSMRKLKLNCWTPFRWIKKQLS